MKSDYNDTIVCCINLKGPQMDLIVRPKSSVVLRTDIRRRIAAATSPSVTRYKALWGLWRRNWRRRSSKLVLGGRWAAGCGPAPRLRRRIMDSRRGCFLMHERSLKRRWKSKHASNTYHCAFNIPRWARTHGAWPLG